MGQAVPEFTAPDLTGAPLDLKRWRGKVVVVHFWATWCPSCREEMPALDAFYVHHHAQGMEVIGISLDRPRDRDSVKAYMSGFHFPAVLLSEAETNGFGAPDALPVTYVIDTHGIVKGIFTPYKTTLSEQVLEGAVVPLLPKR
jgi:peroxiredoxin